MPVVELSSLLIHEVPVGVVNGVNTSFSVSAAVMTDTDVVTVNGQELIRNTGYTISGTTITFLTGYIPQPASGEIPADKIYIRGFKA